MTIRHALPDSYITFLLGQACNHAGTDINIRPVGKAVALFMRLFDPKFKKDAPSYLLQCFVGMLFIMLALFLADTVSSMTVVASLGASTFIAMTMPHTRSAHPRYLIGGYCAGIVCGILMSYIHRYIVSADILFLGRSPHIVTCAVAVGLAMLLMTITNSEHPPAAALAMGLVLEPRVFLTSAAALLGIMIISLLKTLLKRWMKNLL